MSDQDHPLELLIICAAIVIFSVLGLIGGLSSDLSGSLDGLLLIAICLVTFLVFSILLFVLAREKGWLGKRTSKDEVKAAGTAPVTAKK